MIERLGVGIATSARREIERSDAAHNGTMQRLFGIDWEDPSLYAIVLNSARVPVADCVEHIVRLAESSTFQETEQSRNVLLDQLILFRARAAMDRLFGPKPNQNCFDVHVLDDKIFLTGATTDEQMIVDAVRLLQSVEGVTTVESKVAHVAFIPHSD